MNETYTTVVGNIVGAVGRRRAADGTPIANFRVASNERRWQAASGQWGDGDRLFVTVTCWRRLAENVLASFSAGDPVIVHGRLHTSEYEKDGARRSVIEMQGMAVGPDLTHCTSSITRTSGVAAGRRVPEGAAGEVRSDPAPAEVGVGA